MTDRLPTTRGGYDALRERLARLKTIDRREIAREIEIARGHGDLRENADYDVAKNKQGMLEATIRDLDDKLARAEVIDVSQLTGERVLFGATVMIADAVTGIEQTIQIVGEVEADSKVGKINVTSPLARSLIAKHVGDVVKVQSPGGTREYEILDVKYV
ncbi:MAG: transcription elongation factor GreA [Myxococcales bacterium]|nr:transcription elongation factor GreA [Myxococcales bacterium]